MVTVSIFKVFIKDIRVIYTGKYQSIVEKEIKLISQRAIERTKLAFRNALTRFVPILVSPIMAILLDLHCGAMELRSPTLIV